MNHIMSIIRLLRPHQWVKNLFVFLPMFFSGKLFEYEAWLHSTYAFIAFSLAASSIYCLNDLKDVNSDRQHPVKRKRPIASVQVSYTEALILMITLSIASLALSYYLNGWEVAGLILSYILLNLAYCFKLKQISIIDVSIVSTGFVIRVIAGGVANCIILSPWIILMTFLLTLFLAFAKRRDDVLIYEKDKTLVRKNITSYNLPFLNITLGILGCMTMVCYIMYSVSPDVEARFNCRYVYVTSFFVLAGILRYLQLSLVDQKSGSPTKILLADHFIQIMTICWIIAFIIILY